MTNLTKDSNFANKINELEQNLEKVHLQSTQQFPDQPTKRAKMFLDAMVGEIETLLKTMPQENRQEFFSYIKSELNLNNQSAIENFSKSLPGEMENLIKSAF